MLPGWANDIAAVFSILGFGVTLWLLWEARKLKTACLRRVRLPQLHAALSSVVEELDAHVEQWDTDPHKALLQFHQVSAHLDDLLQKLEPPLRDKARALQGELRPAGVSIFRVLRGRRTRLDQRSADEVWDLYGRLSAFVTSLNNSLEDSSWQ